MRLTLTVLLGLFLVPLSIVAQTGHDPHAGHGAHGAEGYTSLVDRRIKALSNEEVDGLLKGEGMGLALSAELNGVPGPLHLLELADALELDAEQLDAIRRIFEEMRSETSRLGEALVELEATLDRRFVHRHIDPEVIRDLTSKIAGLNGEIRAVHLIAHLEVDPLLSDQQRARYQVLRGYVAPEPR
jgi:hypothetical protein